MSGPFGSTVPAPSKLDDGSADPPGFGVQDEPSEGFQGWTMTCLLTVGQLYEV